MKKIALMFCAFLLLTLSLAEACTHGTFLLPMKSGMVPTEQAVPVAIRHQNGSGGYTVQIYNKGDKSPWGDSYVFKHNAYIIQRIPDDPPYRGIICGINETGVGEATQNADGNGGKDDKLVRLKAITMASNFDEMARLIKSEAYENSTYVIGQKNGVWTVGYQIQGKMTIHSSSNSWRLSGEDEGNGRKKVQDMSNWKRGDPNLLEVRDLVHIWRQVNSKGDFAALYLPHLRLMWTTVGRAKNGPMIPFSLDDFYVDPKIAGNDYEKSLESNPFSAEEIDAIEDRIMGIDGSYISKYTIKEVQNRIANRLPIEVVSIPKTSTWRPDSGITRIPSMAQASCCSP